MNRYLLDTHIIIWLLSDPNHLSLKIRDILKNADNVLFYSPLSFCEMAIKVSTGKLTLIGDWQSGFAGLLAKQNILPIAQSWQDAVILQNLPYHHKDPFDRMLISLAMANRLSFISMDKHCRLYNLEVIY